MITFWVLAPLMVLAALGLLFAKKPVHAALSVAAVMIGLACLYAALEAPFLFAVQIIVYTGAIMMLFLFVLMLIGVDTTDELKETIAGHRLVAVIVGLAFAALVAISVGQSVTSAMAGLDKANEGGNVEGIAALLFTRYVIAFEFTAALMITAVFAAMVLAHREDLVPKRTQADNAKRRMADYAETGKHPGNPPTPGVFARSNAVDMPAILPDGTPVDASVSASIVARGQEREAHPEDTRAIAAEIDPHHELGGEDEGVIGTGPAPSETSSEEIDS